MPCQAWLRPGLPATVCGLGAGLFGSRLCSSRRQAACSPWAQQTQVLEGRTPGLHGPPVPPPRVFFDSCDGFFTNYNWREEHLERMLGQAGERLADVYVGVDVFARGNVVGGRFDTNKVGGGL